MVPYHNATEGYVAVWIGNFQKREDFHEYLKRHYEYDEDDDDDIDSQFEVDFDLNYYDRDSVEAVFLDQKHNTLQELFAGSSYLETFKITLDNENKQPFNVIIRVYDYKYVDSIRSCKYDNSILEFYGNVEYEKIVDLSWMGM